MVSNMRNIELWQGDCLQLMDNIADKSVDMILCDLPYGVTAKNKWDIAPGILLCQEAGAFIKGDNGDYTEESNVVIASSSEELYQAILEGLNK